MDSFELNKILGALLATCLAVLSINIAAGALFTAPKLEKPGYEIAVPEDAGGAVAGGAPAADQAQPIEARLASADVARGETAAKKCQACHTFAKGEPNKVGPNLYGVVNRAKGQVAGFNYSAGLKAKGGNWTFENLDSFITNPKAYAQGTSMAFPGVARGAERADIIAFLNSKSDSPAALPKAADAAAAPAAGGPAAAGAPGGAAPAAAPPAGGAAPQGGNPPAAAPAPAPAPAAPAPAAPANPQ